LYIYDTTDTSIFKELNAFGLNKIKVIAFYGWNKEIPNLLKKFSFDSLNEIAIHDSELKVLPDFIFDYNKVKSLRINESKLTELPPEMAKLAKLEEFYLSSSNTVDVKNLMYLPTLKILRLPDTQILNNVEFFSHLSSLEELEIDLFNSKSLSFAWLQSLGRFNRLKSISFSQINISTKNIDSIDDINNIMHLNINYSKAKYVLRLLKIHIFPNLNTISIYHCKLRFIPQILSNYKLLKEIDFSNNRIKNVSPSITNNCNLSYVNLINNKIKKIDKTMCPNQKIVYQKNKW
jgi:Leucine-rich repeat (LRR) protein